MKKIGLKTRWQIGFLLVITVMSAFSFAGSLLTLQSVERETNAQNNDRMLLLETVLEDSWKRVYEYSWQIINNSNAREIDHLNEEDVEQYAVPLFINFNGYIQSNSMVEDFYLYYPGHNIVIGRKGVFSPHVYWSALFGVNEQINEAEWKSVLFDSQKSGYFWLKTGSRPELYYRIASFRDDGRLLVAKINKEELEKMLGRLCSDNQSGFFALVDSERNIYAYAGNYEQYADAETNTIPEESGASVLYTEENSNLTGMTYVTITPKSAAYKMLAGIMRISLAILLASVVISALFAFIFIKRTMQPVETIVDKLQPGEKAVGNEISYISRQIDKLLEENRQTLDSLTNQQNMMIRRSFLSDALKFGYTIQRDIEVVAAFYKQEFENENNAIVIRERAGQDNSTLIMEYLGQVADDDSVLCWTQIQDLDVFLINFGDTAEGQENDLEKLIGMLERHSAKGSRIVSSKTVANLEQVRSCYLECLLSLDRLELAMPTSLRGVTISLEASETSALLGEFQNYLYDEDYLKARVMLPELCRLYFSGSEDRQAFNGQKYYLTMYVKIKKHTAPQEMIRAFIDSQTAEEAEKCLYEILTEMDRQKRSDLAVSSTTDVAGKARCIIDESFDNPMLGLCMIAEQLNFSQSYVSRAFKERYGIGVSQYVNQVRIGKAKELMQSGTKSIKEIALEVGFSGDRQFFRVFKKMEDMTPGDYRAEFDENEE